MVNVKIIDVRKFKNINKYINKLKYIDYKYTRDKKIAIVSDYLKTTNKFKNISISHSWPYCVRVSSNKQIVGVDIENTKRKINWKRLVEKKFPRSENIKTKVDFFAKWTFKEAYYKCTKDIHYLSTLENNVDKKISVKKHKFDGMYMTLCSFIL